jgi:hypothetical protein
VAGQSCSVTTCNRRDPRTTSSQSKDSTRPACTRVRRRTSAMSAPHSLRSLFQSRDLEASCSPGCPLTSSLRNRNSAQAESRVLRTVRVGRVPDSGVHGHRLAWAGHHCGTLLSPTTHATHTMLPQSLDRLTGWSDGRWTTSCYLTSLRLPRAICTASAARLAVAAGAA